jgi:hypothetical protein
MSSTFLVDDFFFAIFNPQGVGRIYHIYPERLVGLGIFDFVNINLQ